MFLFTVPQWQHLTTNSLPIPSLHYVSLMHERTHTYTD